jgi:hypothetical protein
MARPKLRNRRSQAPPVTDEAAPDEAAPHALSAWLGGPGTAPGPAETQPAPAAAPPVPAPAQPADTASQPDPARDADAPDAPFWERWGPAAEASDLDDYGDGLPADGPADDAVTDVDPQPAPQPRLVVTPVGAERGQRPAHDADAEADDARPEGIGEHLGNLAHLSANPRMRTWQRRAIISVIAGLIVGFLLHNWRWGLTLAVLAAIADTIYRSRTSYRGPAGVRLTRAQKRTARQLSSLERKGYRAMHCLAIPDSGEQIDHLVIGRAGAFSIDSEDWDRRMPVRTSSHRQLWHGPHDMRHRLEHAQWEADQAAALLSGELGSTVTVRPAMAVYGPKIPWDVATIRYVDVFSGPRLRKYLRSRSRHRDTKLTAADIERIDKAAHAAFRRDPVS